jgi:hypothetical protein
MKSRSQSRRSERLYGQRNKRRERAVEAELVRLLTSTEDAELEAEIRDALCEDEEIDEDEINADAIEVHDVIGLLRNIEGHQKALHGHMAILHRWLNRSRDLSEAWAKFMRGGGVTADDFALFVDGRFRSRHTRQKRHLRLLVNQ